MTYKLSSVLDVEAEASVKVVQLPGCLLRLVLVVSRPEDCLMNGSLFFPSLGTILSQFALG